MTVDITKIVLGILTILAGIAEIYIIPWIKTKIENEKLVKIIDTIDTLVAAAEQIAERDGYNSAWKKQHVKEILEKNGYTVDETIDDFIEAAVIRLHNELISAS